MKNFIKWCSIGLLVIPIISCQNENMIESNVEEISSLPFVDDVTYPHSSYSQKFSLSMSSTFESDWENLNTITTDHGAFDLPWSQEISDSNLPADFVYDIKKEDGWKMLFHTFNSVDDKKNYMAFYNQRTGLLKVFYYLKENYYPNNGGAWEINFTLPQKVLNFTSELAIPTNLNHVDSWSCTNTVNNPFKAFCTGWNGFQVMLSYDPNISSDCKLDISSHVLNTTNVNLFGMGNSYSKGTILTHGSSNPLSGLTNDIANVFGTNAEKWINDSIIGHNTRSIIGGIGGAIVKYGANKIFSKLTASLSKPTVTRSDLEFSTKSNLNIQGDLTFGSNSPAENLRVAFNKNLIGEVGVWNLAEQPIIYMNPLADNNYRPGIDDPAMIYSYKCRGISYCDYKLLINPELLPFVKKYWIDIEYISYRGQDVPNIPSYYSFGSIGTSNSTGLIMGEEAQIYDNIYDLNFDNFSLEVMPFSGNGYPIPTVFIPKAECFGTAEFDSRNIFMKMSLYTITNFEGKQDTTISTRTFIPKIEWDPKLYKLYENEVWEPIISD